RQRIAAFAVVEFLEQRAAQALGVAADDLAAHQRRIEGAADVIGDAVAFDDDAAGLGIDLHHGDVAAIGVDLMLGLEPALGGKAGLAVAPSFRGWRQILRNGAEADRGAAFAPLAVLAHHFARDDIERLG